MRLGLDLVSADGACGLFLMPRVEQFQSSGDGMTDSSVGRGWLDRRGAIDSNRVTGGIACFRTRAGAA